MDDESRYESHAFKNGYCMNDIGLQCREIDE